MDSTKTCFFLAVVVAVFVSGPTAVASENAELTYPGDYSGTGLSIDEFCSDHEDRNVCVATSPGTGEYKALSCEDFAEAYLLERYPTPKYWKYLVEHVVASKKKCSATADDDAAEKSIVGAHQWSGGLAIDVPIVIF